MAALMEILPPVKSSSSAYYDHSVDPWLKDGYCSSEVMGVKVSSSILQYPNRAGNKSFKADDFGDGGAYPEFDFLQYPLGIGRTDGKADLRILPVTVDSRGNVDFDAIVKQNENALKIVKSQHMDLVPKILRRGEEEDDEVMEEEEQKEIEETTLATKMALEKIVNVRSRAAQPKNVGKESSESEFIKYKPSQPSAAGAKERVIRMVEMPVDPLEPPKFKHKRVPRASGSPPVPIMHSPPRPVTVKDQQDWKIPPCVSNWKNPKGYTIPLDKRLAADGRGLQDVEINDSFAKLSEALYVAEQKAREAVAMRTRVQKEVAMKEKERREDELRALAEKARAERTAAPLPAVPFPSEQREKIRRRERERERRLEAKEASKSKITRDRERDVSEKLALGMASAGAGRGGEVMYDQRLFNQDKGMDSGFAADDQYNLYDKGLFTAQSTLCTLYRGPKKDADSEMYGGAEEQLEKIRKTDRFNPDKKRDRPVEFDNDAVEEADPFGLDQFLTELKKGKKAVDKVGDGGTMKSSGGDCGGRTSIHFDRGH